MKKIIMLSLASMLSLNSFAEQNMTTTLPNNIQQKAEAKSAVVPFTSEQIQTLEGFLKKGEYQEFFVEIKKYKVSKDQYIKYLQAKQYEGHIPLYWLIADYYAKENNPIETHKWLYIALIMTQQDSYLCSDSTARNAPRTISVSFQTPIDVTRKTPQHIDTAMREVIYFITNLKTRISPLWACYYGEETIPKGNNVLIPQGSWNDVRANVFKRFTEKYQK